MEERIALLIQETDLLREGIEFAPSNFKLDLFVIDQLCDHLEWLCSACTEVEHAELLNQLCIWPTLSFLFITSTPCEELLQFKPEVDQELMSKVLAAAQSGKPLSQEDLASSRPSEQSHEQLLLRAWGRLRRGVTAVFRNVVRFPDIEKVKKKIFAEEDFILALCRVCTDGNEEGNTVSYACTIMRFLLPAYETETIQNWHHELVNHFLHPDVLPFIIGTAVTSRVVHLPDGSRLWVHIEATRLVSSIIQTIHDESLLPSLLTSARALCDGILMTTHPSMHVELSRSLLRLMENCPAVTAIESTIRMPDSISESPTVPQVKKTAIQVMVLSNERRLVAASLGMLIMNTKEVMQSSDNMLSKQAVLLSLRMLNHIAPTSADALLEENAEEVLNVIGNVIPEAIDVLAFIHSFRADVDDDTQESASPGWFCRLL